MAARWGTRSRKRSISTMELFTGVSPLQCHPLEEDGGISDLGLPPLDTCDLLGTFRGYIDPTIISIIEGAGSQNEIKGRYDEENELSLLTALTEILDNADDENLSPFDSIPDSELLVSQRDRDLHRFLSLSRSPPDRNHLPVDDFKGFKTHANNATFRKVETRTEDGWGMFPDCLGPIPMRRSKGKSVRKSIQRVREASTLQLSDGEEKVGSPDHDTSSESGVDFVDFGMDFEELSTGRTIKEETSASKHRTPHIINTESISLTDLVKYMHSYCLPNQTVLDSGNSKMDEDSGSNGKVLEIGDYLAVPAFLVNSNPDENISPVTIVDANVNCAQFLEKETLTKDKRVNVNAVRSKESHLSESGNKESMPPKEPISTIHSVRLENLDPPPLQKAETDLEFDKSIEKLELVTAEHGSVQCKQSENFVSAKREVPPKLAPEMNDGMPLLQPEPRIGDWDFEPGMDKQIPALHPQPADVIYCLGLQGETQIKYKDIDSAPILKREYLPNDDELKKQVQPTGPEISDLQNAVHTKTKTLEGIAGRQDLEMDDWSSAKPCSLTQASGSQASDMVQVEDEIEPKLNSDMPAYFEKPIENVDFTLMSKRKCHGRKNVTKISYDQSKKEVQNVKNKHVYVLPKSPYAPQLSEFADCETMQLKVSLQGASCLNSPLKESDLLIKQLEKAKRESDIEMKLLKASRAVKSRARNNGDTSNTMSIFEKKNSPVREREAEQCKFVNKAFLLVPTKDLLENVEPSLTSSMEVTGAGHVPKVEVNEPSKTPPIDVNISKENGKCESDVAPSASSQGDPIEVQGEKGALTHEESVPGYAKDVKPKLLSLTEYRMRMQQRKINTEGDKKENENLMSNKWPSITEPPTELAEIPCLMKPKVEKDSQNSAKSNACQQPFMRDSPESPDQEFHENAVTSDIPLAYKPDSATMSACLEKTSAKTAPVLAVRECTKPVSAGYAGAPSSPWPPISSLPSRYPFLPPVPPPSLSSNAFPPLPIPSPLLSWPPPFPPPPVATAPFPPFPPGWAPCIPPPPLPPPPYWLNIPLPPSVPPPPIVPPPMYCDVGPPLHCPPGFPYPPSMLSAPVQGAEYSLTNAANLSQSIRSTEQKAPSTGYQNSPDVFKSIHVPNQDAQNTNVHVPKITEFGIPAVPPVVPNYAKTALAAPVKACQSQTQVGTNKMAKQVCNPLKPIQQAAELKVQTICAPKSATSSKVTLLNNPAGTGKTKLMDTRSTNELVLKIFELLRKAQNTPVKATVSTPLISHSGQMVLPSVSQHSSAGPEPVVSMNVKPFDTAPSINQKQEPVVEPCTSNDETTLLLRTPATKGTVLSVTEKLQKPLFVTGQSLHPVVPLENLQEEVSSVVLKPTAVAHSVVLKPQEAVPTTLMKPQEAVLTTVLKPQATIPSVVRKLQIVQSTMLKSQMTKPESQTTLRSEVALVKLEPQHLLPSTASKPQDVIASLMVQKSPLVPQALIPMASGKCQIAEGNLSSVKEKKMKKLKVNIRKKGIICKEKAIEACDVTSLLEQFEKSEEKEEKHCPQSSGDSLAVTNSRLEAEVESKQSYTLLVKGLGSTAELTPPATPPHQPQTSLILLGNSSILNTALREGVNNSPVKRVKLIDTQPLPQTRHRRQCLLPQNIPQTPAVHVGFGDHDYCFLQASQSETVPDATQIKMEPGLSQPGTLAVEGSRWNVKHHQSIVIKPIVSLSKRSEKDCKVPLSVPGSAQSSGKSVPCSPVECMSQNNIEAKEWMDQLDHRTSLPNEANIDCSSTSVLLSPEASPCNSDGGELRTQDGRANTTVPKRSLRCYRKYKDSTSLQSADWKSRRTRGSRSSCCSSESGDSSSSYSSSSSSSRSRSRSTPPKKRRRYRSVNSRHSRSSSRSNYGSCGRSRGRSSSVSTFYSSRSYSTSYSRSRSRSRSQSRSPCPRRYDYYGNRANYRRQRVPQQECAIEERRVVYIGKIPGVMTRAELKHRFSVFGLIEECNIHFRDHGDNYGFVTYRYTDDAFTAIEHGHKLRRPDELPFDLCFGGRRQFCKSNYADLDSNRGDYDPVKNKFDSLDFDTLLKQAQKSIRR